VPFEKFPFDPQGLKHLARKEFGVSQHGIEEAKIKDDFGPQTSFGKT